MPSGRWPWMAVEQAKSGHPGMPMGMADVATVLFTQFLKFDAGAPDWPDRDRFVLSAGHGSMLLYALLHLTGVPGMSIDELKHFRQLGSKTAGHPEFGHAPGIETTTGPLGQGLGNAVGMALAERMLNARHGDGIVDHHTYVIAGDGCLMEGISQEAISLAGHLKLGKLIVLFDDNSISIDGATSLAVSDDQVKRFEASGWAATRIDGHDPAAIAKAIAAARSLRPADADRLQDGDRLRRADQAGQGVDARRAARRGGDQGRAREARLGACGLRGAGRCAGRLADGRCARRSSAQGLGAARGQDRAGDAARSDRCGGGRGHQGGHRRDQGRVHGRAAQARHAPVLAEGAGEAGAGAAGADRRLGGPHRIERHAHQASHVGRGRTISAATTSTTACASTAWRRP